SFLQLHAQQWRDENERADAADWRARFADGSFANPERREVDNHWRGKNSSTSASCNFSYRKMEREKEHLVSPRVFRKIQRREDFREFLDRNHSSRSSGQANADGRG